jgi:hypothetical protein
MLTGWFCSNCKVPRADPGSSEREACAVCGSKAYTAEVSATECLEIGVYSKTHTKHREGKKVVREVISGDDLYRKSGKWNLMHRLIDRANNWYEEVFHDRETKEVIHKTAEPLSEHRSKLTPK